MKSNSDSHLAADCWHIHVLLFHQKTRSKNGESSARNTMQGKNRNIFDLHFLLVCMHISFFIRCDVETEDGHDEEKAIFQQFMRLLIDQSVLVPVCLFAALRALLHLALDSLGGSIAMSAHFCLLFLSGHRIL